MARTFIAIDIKPEAELVEGWNRLRVILKHDSVKWVDPKLLHLTLLFLGDTPDHLIGKISISLAGRLVSHPVFSIAISGMGTFGNPKPRVIWLGVEPSVELQNLKFYVDEILLPFGFVDENYPYKPHLTLGRVNFLNDIRPIQEFMGEVKENVWQKVNVDRITFYRSTLTAAGPIYEPLKVIELKGV
ncbi:MAG: RNA 2',3'-cyclic phosphodiesterase [Bacteroidales bacterium]